MDKFFLLSIFLIFFLISKCDLVEYHIPVDIYGPHASNHYHCPGSADAIDANCQRGQIYMQEIGDTRCVWPNVTEIVRRGTNRGGLQSFADRSGCHPPYP